MLAESPLSHISPTLAAHVALMLVASCLLCTGYGFALRKSGKHIVLQLCALLVASVGVMLALAAHPLDDAVLVKLREHNVTLGETAPVVRANPVHGLLGIFLLLALYIQAFVGVWFKKSASRTLGRLKAIRGVHQALGVAVLGVAWPIQIVLGVVAAFDVCSPTLGVGTAACFSHFALGLLLVAVALAYRFVALRPEITKSPVFYGAENSFIILVCLGTVLLSGFWHYGYPPDMAVTGVSFVVASIGLLATAQASRLSPGVVPPWMAAGVPVVLVLAACGFGMAVRTLQQDYFEMAYIELFIVCFVAVAARFTQSYNLLALAFLFAAIAMAAAQHGFGELYQRFFQRDISLAGVFGVQVLFFVVLGGYGLVWTRLFWARRRPARDRAPE